MMLQPYSTETGIYGEVLCDRIQTLFLSKVEMKQFLKV